MTTVSTPRRRSRRRRRRSSISFTKQIDQIARPEAARQSSRGTVRERTRGALQRRRLLGTLRDPARPRHRHRHVFIRLPVLFRGNIFASVLETDVFIHIYIYI